MSIRPNSCFKFMEYLYPRKAGDIADAEQVAKELGVMVGLLSSDTCCGRGKVGGVKLAKNLIEVAAFTGYARQRLVTIQPIAQDYPSTHC